MSSKCLKVTVTLTPQVFSIVEFLRSSAEIDLGIPVSFDDAINAVICTFSHHIDVGLGGDDVGDE